MTNNDILETIKKIIIKETKYNRLYNGKVVSVKDKKVLCSIDALGWDTDEKSVICYYTNESSMINLKINDIVIIGFVNSNPAQGVILGLGNNFLNIPVKTYNLNNKIETIFEDRAGTTSITKNDLNKDISIKNPDKGKINIGKSNESFVKGDTALVEFDKDKNLMQSLQSILNAWVPVPQDGGDALKNLLLPFLSLPQADYSNILSKKIKGE